jgi:hypothetical protein
MRRTWLAVLALALPAGCNPSPVAPALSDDPVYANSREGVRFMAPDGWSQMARGDPAPSDKDRVLVRYQSPGAGAPANLELSRADLPESADLAQALASPSHGSNGLWQPVGRPEPLTVGGSPGTRYTFSNQKMTKETTAIRRGARVYFFTAVFRTTDDETRQTTRRVVNGATWTK